MIPLSVSPHVCRGGKPGQLPRESSRRISPEPERVVPRLGSEPNGSRSGALPGGGRQRAEPDVGPELRFGECGVRMALFGPICGVDGGERMSFRRVPLVPTLSRAALSASRPSSPPFLLRSAQSSSPVPLPRSRRPLSRRYRPAGNSGGNFEGERAQVVTSPSTKGTAAY